MSEFIVAENRYHQKILLDSQDVIGKTILRDGLYDNTGLYFIEKILSKLHQPVIFDVGASIGNHALRMSEYAQMVYLFEPQVKLAEYLQQTMSLNQLKNWKILSFGLSDENKTLTLYKNLNSNIETSFVSELKHKNFLEEQAFVRVGDEVVAESGIDRLDFVKIDVEGFEAKVIQGLKNSITKFRPIIFMEWDKEITKREFKEQDLFKQVLTEYNIKAITRNPAEASFPTKIIAKIRRLFSGTTRKRHIIGNFDPLNNYRHIVCIPSEKQEVINEL